MDTLVDGVLKRVTYDHPEKDVAAKLRQARKVSETINDVMRIHGFTLYVDTVALSDSLVSWTVPGKTTRHFFDCDTGSLIYLTIAEKLGAPVSMVEITLPIVDMGHNYVRWQVASDKTFEWDMNDSTERATPQNLPPHEGISMTRDQVLGYALVLRGDLWSRSKHYVEALADFRKGISLHPNGAILHNNFAWLVATRDFPERGSLKDEALTRALAANKLLPNANHLDTLACVHALRGDFDKAIAIETEALKLSGKQNYRKRIAMFKSRKDCTGEQ